LACNAGPPEWHTLHLLPELALLRPAMMTYAGPVSVGNPDTERTSGQTESDPKLAWHCPNME